MRDTWRGLTFVMIVVAAGGTAAADTKMSYLDPDDQITASSVTTPTGPETYLSFAGKLSPSETVTCRNVFVPITFFQPCTDFNFCPDPFSVHYAVRHVCTHHGTQPSATLKIDSTGKLWNVLNNGAFEVADVSALPNPANRIVSFGFSPVPSYVNPTALGGRCPAGTVLISSPDLASLGNKNLCVQITPTNNDALVQSQATARFASIASNPANANADLPALRDVLQSVLGGLVAAVACQTDAQGAIVVCLRNQGHVDLPSTLSFGHGLCPVEPDPVQYNACVGRHNQTPIGCALIACVDALDALGMAGCVGAISAEVGISNFTTLAAGTTCALIARRDHFYTAPAGPPLEICSTAESPDCTISLVLTYLYADVRRQAPFVLSGPPSGGFARGLLTTPLPIDQANPSKLYYLGAYLPFLNINPNTSNPIRVTVPHDTTCIAAVNTADQDHLLEGTASNCIFQSGSSIYSEVVGQGSNTRFALLNELVGPRTLGTAQLLLKNAIHTRLHPPPPLPPPCGVGVTCQEP